MIKNLKIIITCLFLAITISSVTANAQVVRTKYTVLDSFKMEFSGLFGVSQRRLEIKYVELENLDHAEILRGIEMEIVTSKNDISAKSLALINSGWITGSLYKYYPNYGVGFVFLVKEDLKEVVDFFNIITNEIGNLSDKRHRVLKITLSENFEYGIIFKDTWSFFLSAQDAVYGLSYADGITISKKLNEYYSDILDHSTLRVE